MPLSINPANEELIEEYSFISDAALEQKLQHADERFQTWRTEGWDERRGVLTRVANLLRDRQAWLAELMTHEMGKPITQAEAEVAKCAWVCDYYAEHGERFPRAPSSSRRTRHVRWCGSIRWARSWR